MKIKTIWPNSVVAIVAYAIMLLSSLTAHSELMEGFTPDHYLSYEIKSASIKKHHIKLRDQFVDWTDFIARKPVRLLNPTLKRHNNQVVEIQNPELHYTAFELLNTEEISVVKPVLVLNQFGNFTLQEFRPSRLLVPSRKKVLSLFDMSTSVLENQPAIEGDHYLCYDIPPFDVSTDFGFLKDQFKSRVFEKLVATRFCNPAAKIHKNKIYEISNNDPSNHLMCFELERERIFKIVALLNQFGLQKAAVVKDDELCVPSVKIEIPEGCDGATPGSDGECNGVCPNLDDQCVYDPATNLCSCVPNEPRYCKDMSPDSDGMCNGICPDPFEICIADAIGQCSCVPEHLPCNDSFPGDNGQCNGVCAAGEICVVTQEDKCECRAEDPPCGFDPNGQCGGSCKTTSEVCTIVPGTNFCGCVMQMP